MSIRLGGSHGLLPITIPMMNRAQDKMNDLYVIGLLPLCRAHSLFSSSLQSMKAISGVKAAPEAVELPAQHCVLIFCII